MKDLTNFFEDKKKLKSTYEITNWNEMKEKWVSQIEDFFSTIKEWLNDSIRKGLIEVKEAEIEISEENLGNYKTKSLQISFENKKVEFVPIGRLVIGAQGRIDIKFINGRYILLYDDGWKYLDESGIQKKLIDFDEKCFTEMMEKIFS
ncbi:MAG: hypothetical protein M1542_01495 [Thermotogae bacterium]|jgi:hypothetical protein|nr:hypothetical protein [Thermotogota bacterium]MCL5031911.1 hypothetical protein [Thermotogota bacterium]